MDYPPGDRTDLTASRMADLLDALEAERTSRRGSAELSDDESFVPDGGGASVEAVPVITSAVLTTVVPEAADAFRSPLDETCRAFEITTPLRIAHFLAQTAHESARYTALVENLNYSAAGLLATWPSRFDQASAAAYARQPEKIANKVYADRMGNGPEESGDGWRYRGRGILQVTGRAAYRAFSEFLGEDVEMQPDLLATPRLAALAAGWYWQARGINELCDRDDAVAVTEAVNGGRHGLEKRMELLGQVKAALGGDAVA